MNISTTGKILCKAFDTYNQLIYIKNNKEEVNISEKNINNLETQYDELLDSMGKLLTFSSSQTNIEKLHGFLLRYSEKIKKEYTKSVTRENTNTKEKTVKGLEFGEIEKLPTQVEAKL